MTLAELYTIIGGDYEMLFRRFRDEAQVKKFLALFLRDSSFAELTDSMNTADGESAFRAVHTLKGIAGNLCFTPLYQSASALTEALRNGKILTDRRLYTAVTEDYRAITAVLTEYLAADA